ncbi:MAG: hypothetical protein Q8W51_02685 [Candidatus Palauibacterales bacterium]|nr:hypothetical protein [Candidatus Palauibacterales bacterium]MDP2528617.1 hypothetical protein [Candidatus Palauibacterales bacterium]MDP2583741.1 hypothetical protein [Candidatus Palauibacterales bacterium]
MIRTVRTALVLLLATGGPAACARQARVESGPADSAATDTATGTVRQVGNTPFVRTIVEDPSGAVRIVGPYESEISRLVGARVQAVGVIDSASRGRAMGPDLRASGYTILSVDGDRPTVGYLRRSDAGDFFLRTEEGHDVPLSSVSSALADQVGAKVWVVTNAQGAVARYGILKRP